MTALRTLIDTASCYTSWARLAWRRSCPPHRQPADRQPHILILAWAFPPATTGGVYRPMSLARYGVEQGWQVSVLSAEPPGPVTPAGQTLLDSLPGTVRLYRFAPGKARRPGYRLFPRISGGFVHALTMGDTAIRALCADPPSHVIATGPPFNTFVAGRYLARWFGAELILDYRDEWTLCPFTFADTGNDDLTWEKRCLAAADRIVFTTRSQLEHNLHKIPAAVRGTRHVIPNGWEPEDFDEAVAPDPQHPGTAPLRLSFIGTLGDHTLPALFLAMMARIFARRQDLVERVILQFIGTRTAQGQAELDAFPFPGTLLLRDHLVKQEANRLMMESTALLLFYGEDFSRYIPGKFYDYLAAGRPVMVIGNRGEVVEVMEELQTGHVIEEGDDRRLEKVLDQLLADRPGAAHGVPVREWLDRHTRRQMAAQFSRLITG